MPDTGAPWNIPYVTSADLVSDWPADSLALANAIDAGLDAAGNAGIGSNVVQTVKSNAFTTTSTSFVDVTGFSVSITPTSATAKILVLANFSAGNAGTDQTFTQLLRDSTAVMNPTHFYGHFGSERNRDRPNVTAVYLDSPATTSATTYKLQIRTSSGTAYFNRDVVSTPNVCTITAIEVAA